MSLNLTAFQLKLIALTGMTIQHIAIVFSDRLPIVLQFPMQLAGGMTFPILAFLLIEGYRNTSSIIKYLMRLYIFGAIAQIPFMLAFGVLAFNIMFTLAVGLTMVVLYDKIKHRALFWLIFFPVVFATSIFDWPIIGVAMILMYHILEGEYRRRTAPAAFGGLALLFITHIPNFMYTGRITPVMLFPVGCMLAMPLNWAYNGRRGRNWKMLFYAYYPAHLTVLAGIAFFMGLTDFSIITDLLYI